MIFSTFISETSVTTVLSQCLIFNGNYILLTSFTLARTSSTLTCSRDPQLCLPPTGARTADAAPGYHSQADEQNVTQLRNMFPLQGHGRLLVGTSSDMLGVQQ